MTSSLEGWPTKAKEASSPHEVRLALLDTKPVFQSLRGNSLTPLLFTHNVFGAYKTFKIEQIQHNAACELVRQKEHLLLRCIMTLGLSL